MSNELVRQAKPKPEAAVRAEARLRNWPDPDHLDIESIPSRLDPMLPQIKQMLLYTINVEDGIQPTSEQVAQRTPFIDLALIHFSRGRYGTPAQEIFSGNFMLGSPGYYGMKGKEKMATWGMNKFRRGLLQGRHSLGRLNLDVIWYTVLPSELAARLIAEDLGITVKEARKVVYLSYAYGELYDNRDEAYGNH
jgi:RTC4-like domain